MFNVADHPVPGPAYFLTLRLADRKSDLLVKEVERLRHAMRETIQHHPLRIEAITVLPAVLHTIWTLPKDDQDLAKRVALLKSLFAKDLPPAPHRTLFQIQRRDKGIWQRRIWDHQIRDAADFMRHRDLIYLSPVHADLCAHPRDWIYTSLHRDTRSGFPVPLGGIPATEQGQSAARSAQFVQNALSDPGPQHHSPLGLPA